MNNRKTGLFVGYQGRRALFILDGLLVFPLYSMYILCIVNWKLGILEMNQLYRLIMLLVLYKLLIVLVLLQQNRLR